MKKFKLFPFIVSLFIIFGSVSNAQSIKLGLGGGLTSIESPSQYTNDISNHGYGFKNNYHLTIMAKLDIPLIPIIPAVFIDYHILRGSGSFKDTSVENIQTSLNIFTLGIEGEYILLPLPFVKPFILVDLLYNDFGELNITSGPNTYVQPSKSSTGYAVGIGATLTLIPAVDFDLSLKYNKRGQDFSGYSVSDLTLNLVMIF